MGNVSSRPDDGAAVYLRDQTRFSIGGLSISNSRGRRITVSPNAFPTSRYYARRDDNDTSPLDYVQDPETLPGAPPAFLLRLTNEEELTFNFTCIIRQQSTGPSASLGEQVVAVSSAPALDTQLTGLTYIFASNDREIEQLTTREFHADPNLHRNPNVELVGHYGTDGTPSVQFNWTWTWRAPKPAEDRGGGWRNTCSFVEYNQRAHRLDTLATFSFWVQSVPQYPFSPQQLSPKLDTLYPPRLRVPSTQSVESRISAVSDSDGGDVRELREPGSPYIESIPEYSLGLVPTMTNGPLPKVDVNCVGRPGEDVSSADDGPVFRATMRSLENKTGTMKSRMKRVLKAAEAAQSAQAACNNAVADFMDALRDASNTNANAVRPALEHYFDSIANEILLYEKQNNANLQKLIIEPISKLYSVDIKQAEYKRRDFEEESKDFYAYVGKYLGQRSESLKEKKRVESDAKYQAKRRTFELKRFDYSSFMHDLNGGRKEQEVLSQLTKYADAQSRGFLNTSKRIAEMMPQLEALCSAVSQVDKEFQLQRTERETKRRALETSTKIISSDADPVPPPSAFGQRNFDLDPYRTSSNVGSRTSALSTSPSATNGFPTSMTGAPTAAAPLNNTVSNVPQRNSSNKFKGFRDLEDKDISAPGITQHRKEGLLWSLSRPGGHVDPIMTKAAAWHKFWIVLDQGKLSEYANWKDRLDLHMEPIDLRVASVREARNAERRFCFEVITPQFTRVYQAPSEEDMKSWIGAINNALQSAFESRPSTASAEHAPAQHNSTRNNIAAVLTGKSLSTGHRASAHVTSYTQGSTPKTTVSRHATTGDKPHYLRANSDDANSSALLNQIREADAGNKFCADCNGESKVDWVSINLGIVLCIECSGIHRSLGTHISKVRSLTLDTAAFTPDIIDLLLLLGNRVSNMIWEARLDRFLKPSPHSTREQRLHFITAKYSSRTYAQPLPLTSMSHFGTPDETLLASIKKNEIHNVLYALAIGANPNATDRMRATPAVYLALAAADPASPGTSASLSPSNSTASSGFSHSRGTSTITLKDYGPGIPLSPRPITPVSPSTASSPTSSCSRKPFAIAELLLQNGADIPTQPAPIPLSPAARQYLEFKIDQRTGRHLGLGVRDSAGDTIGALPSISAGGSGNSPNHRDREREGRSEWRGEGIVKRLSSGSYGKR
ncbi:hypothetical protein AAFC00_003787 [Neodothiora populina]|uniref:ADP-ribosylation factor GTPase-activating protein n=1 Tax=Neodothiora populina TaxID=2781224 RepID=A0ABR3PFE1_9PEZI